MPTPNPAGDASPEGQPVRPNRPAAAVGGSGRAAFGSVYDPIAGVYDEWSRSVREDIDFYVGLASSAGGPVVELAVGTGRIAVAAAEAGVSVIGVDSSEEMLAECHRRAKSHGVEGLLDLRLGDLASPPVDERVDLVLVPFRSYLHLHADRQRRQALRAAYDLLTPGGLLVFDVFCPSEADIDETHARWLEREPGIWEHAEWNRSTRRLNLSVRSERGETTMELAWLEPHEWLRLLEATGFCVEDCYGWFDRRPFAGGEDSVWVARRPA